MVERVFVMLLCVVAAPRIAVSQPVSEPTDAGMPVDAEPVDNAASVEDATPIAPAAPQENPGDDIADSARAAARIDHCEHAREILALLYEIDPVMARDLAQEREMLRCIESHNATPEFPQREAVFGWRGYLEPSVFMLVSFGTIPDSYPVRLPGVRAFMRFATGARIVRYGPGGRTPTHFRLGISVYLSPRPETQERAGIGAEVGMDRVLSPLIALGARAGLETAYGSRALLTLGPRLYVGSNLSVGVDFFHFTSEPIQPTGVMFELGLHGKPATYLTFPLAVLLPLIALSK